MKKLLVGLLAVCLLATSALAAPIPGTVTCENVNGRQLITKTYTLSPDENPDTLLEMPFEQEGYPLGETATTPLLWTAGTAGRDSSHPRAPLPALTA